MVSVTEQVFTFKRRYRHPCTIFVPSRLGGSITAVVQLMPTTSFLLLLLLLLVVIILVLLLLLAVVVDVVLTFHSKVILI